MRFRRKNIRVAPEDYRGTRWYFVTICCDRRRRRFASGRHAGWLIEHLRRVAAASSFYVHAYCVMPDHLHLLVQGAHAGSDMLQFVGNFKLRTGLAWRRRFGSHLWQHKFYDHILRATDAPDSVAWYIWMNPTRAGLCAEPREYALSGSFTMPWKETAEPPAAWTPPWKKPATPPV